MQQEDLSALFAKIDDLSSAVSSTREELLGRMSKLERELEFSSLKSELLMNIVSTRPVSTFGPRGSSIVEGVTTSAHNPKRRVTVGGPLF